MMSEAHRRDYQTEKEVFDSRQTGILVGPQLVKRPLSSLALKFSSESMQHVFHGLNLKVTGFLLSVCH